MELVEQQEYEIQMDSIVCPVCGSKAIKMLKENETDYVYVCCNCHVEIAE